MILSKKIGENKKIWNDFLTLLNRGYHLIIIWILFLIWFFDYNFVEASLSINDILLFIIASWAIYVTYNLRRTAYANEKVSVLQPYAMLFQVFPIIIWFIFIATERMNVITFIFAIIASIIVIFANINLKNLKINRYSMMILTSSIIKSFQVFAVIYFLKKLNPASFYFTETIIIICISIILLIFKKEYKEIKLVTFSFLKLIVFVNSIVIASILLSLSMYSNLWVVTTSLLSLLYILFIYILWYFILKEKPTKKDLIITWLVVICIIIWLYFKT